MQVLLKQQVMISFYRTERLKVKLLVYILLFNSEMIRDANLNRASQT
jgi:hypothetical protein